MEATIIFAGEPLVLPPLHKEKELIRKLDKKFASKAGFKWLFTITGLGVTAAAIYMSVGSPKEPARNASLPAASPVPATVTVGDSANTTKQSLPAAPLVPVPEVPDVPVAEAAPAQVPAPPIFRNIFEEHIIEENISSVNAQQTPDQNAGSPAPMNSGVPGKISVDTLFKDIKRLEVDVALGYVYIETGNTDKVSIKGEISIEKKGLMVNEPDYKVSYDRTGDILKVRIENAVKAPTVMVGSIKQTGGLNFVVPEKTDVLIITSSGDIRAKGLAGSVCELESRYGNITMSAIRVPSKVKARSGDMTISDIQGDMEVYSGYGDQSFTDIRGNIKDNSVSGNVQINKLNGNLDLAASYGDITLAQLKGDIKISSRSGNVKGETLKGNSLAIEATYGDISLVQVKSDIRIVDRSGDVSGQDLEGKTLDIEANYGDIKLLNVKADLSIDSRSGNISLKTISGAVKLKSTYGAQDLVSINGDITSESTSGNVNLKSCEGRIDLKLGYGNADLQDCKGDMKIHTTSGNIRGKNIELKGSMDLKAVFGDIHMNIHNPMNDLAFRLETISGVMKVDKDGTRQSKDKGVMEVGKGSIRITATTQSGNQTYF